MDRILVIAHREELIRQACDKIERVVGERPAIEMGNERADEGESFLHRARVVVSSIQTQNSSVKCWECAGKGCELCGNRGRRFRMETFSPHEFSLVIIDEAHHAPAVSYRRLIQHYQQNKQCKLLGVTATPDRADEAALGQIFETVAFDYQLPNAIADGWLVDIEQQFVRVEGLDLSAVRDVAGDLNAGQVDEIMRQEKVLHGVVHPTIELAGDSPTLLFAASVEHAHKAAEIFNRHKANSAIALDGTTDSDERRYQLERFARGEYQYLCNCALFLEGFDEPRIACVAVARPTKSRALYSQIVGRGTRTNPSNLCDGLPDHEQRKAAILASGKPSLLVLDFVGNSGRHKLITTADILGGNESDEVIGLAHAQAAKKSAAGERTNMRAEIEAAKRAIAARLAERRKQVIVKAQYSTQKISAFDVLDITPQREPGWHKGRRPSAKMLAILDKQGIPTANISFVHAGQIIGKLKERWAKKLCTYKQAKLLQKFGYSSDVTMPEATKIIDALAKNKWRRP